MLFQEYVAAKKDRERAEELYKGVLREIEDVFEMTQPKSLPTDIDRVVSSPGGGPFDLYLAEKERRQLDQRLEEAERLMNARDEILREKKEALFRSLEPEDVVFREKYVIGTKPSVIARKTNYSQSQVYRLIQKIHAKI